MPEIEVAVPEAARRPCSCPAGRFVVGVGLWRRPIWNTVARSRLTLVGEAASTLDLSAQEVLRREGVGGIACRSDVGEAFSDRRLGVEAVEGVEGVGPPLPGSRQ